MKKWLAFLLCLCLCLTPALAAEDDAPAEQRPSRWTVPYLADARALKLVDDDYAGYINDPITAGQLTQMAEQVYAKLALLHEGETAAPALAAEGVTRGDVVRAIGAAVKAAGFDDAEPVAALQKLGVLRGDGVSLALERTCTYEEAMVMATRTILGAYDAKNAGSKGLLWKATKGESTVYLLGTAHMDRGNLYPFHQTLREAISSADTVVLELDFQDQEGMAEFVAMQTYPEGDGLKNHVSAELYTRTVNAFAALGLAEEQTNTYKPWALANTVTSLMTSDETAGDAPLAIDLYVNAAAANAGKPVAGAETYALQGGIFDTLSEDYQTAYLESGVAVLEATLTPPADGPQEPDPEVQAALEAQEQMLADMMTAWQTADLELFHKTYDKTAVVNSDDELNARLFTDRDPNMVKVAQSYLEREGKHTAFLAFGAGHMVAPGGIVPELEKLGYAVEQVTDYQAVPPKPAALPQPKPEPEPEPEPVSIALSFAGDTMLTTYPNTTSATNFNGYAAAKDPAYFLSGVREVFANDDLTVVNLENVVSDRSLKPVEKSYTPAYWYKAPTQRMGILTAGSVEMVSIANNHTEDYGEEGLEDTKAAAEAAGLKWGNRDRTVYFEKDGYRIAILCGGMWNNTTHLNVMKGRLAEAQADSDFQIVLFHGGTERVHAPEKWKVNACHALVDAGADLVLGGHPHVLQPKETYKGVDIVYSLGNFCYGGSARPENATAIYRLELEVTGGTLTAKTGELIPCRVYTGARNDFRPVVMDDSPEKQAVLDFMNGLRKSPV